MRRFGRWLVLILLVVGSAQTGKTTKVTRKPPGTSKPECSQGAICLGRKAIAEAQRKGWAAKKAAVPDTVLIL
jgi:hypothetical protein